MGPPSVRADRFCLLLLLDGRNPFRLTPKPWLKPERLLGFLGESHHSKVSSVQDFVHPQYHSDSLSRDSWFPRVFFAFSFKPLGHAGVWQGQGGRRGRGARRRLGTLMGLFARKFGFERETTSKPPNLLGSLEHFETVSSDRAFAGCAFASSKSSGLCLPLSGIMNRSSR